MKHSLARTRVYSFVTVLAPFCAGLGLAPTEVPAADNYPSETIRWIVPLTAGGSFDRLARMTAPGLSERLGVTVVVSNVPGPDGYNRIYHAKPDGYTIGSGDALGEHAKALIQKQVFDITKFSWFGRGSAGVNLMVASDSSKIRKFSDLKASDRPVRFSAFGFATPTVQFVVLAERLKLPYKIVNFRGPRESVIGVVRGDADIGHVGTGLWLKHINAGSVHPILAWSDEPDRRQPKVPTLQAADALSVAPLMVQRAFMGPPGLPKAIYDKLVGTLRTLYASDEFKAQLSKRNFETNPLWGDDFQEELTKLRSLLKAHAESFRKAAGVKG